MKKIIKAGATDQTLDIFIQDSSSTTGGGLTGLAYNTASLVCYYRKGATGSATALTLVTQTVGGAHSDGGFVAIDGTNMPGMYRLDLSDTIVATAGSVTLMLKGAANMAPLTIELQVSAVNLEDSVRFGMTALPNAAADAAGGLPISDAGGLDLDAKLANTNEVTVARMGALTDWINGGRLDLILDIIAADVVNIDGAAMRGTDNAALASVLGAAVGASISADIAAVKSDTAATLIDTAEIGAAGAGLTALASAANLATLAAYVDTEVAAILVDTGTDIPAQISALNNLSAAQVNAEVDTALADYDAPTNTEMVAAFTEIKGASWSVTDTLEAIRDRGDAAWITATGFSTLSAADVRSAVGLASANLDTQLSVIDGVVDSILVDTAEIGAAGAGLTALASAANLATLTGYVDTEVAAIKAKTDNLPADPADASDIAASFVTVNSKLDTIDDFLDSEIAAILEDTGTTIPAQIAALTIPTAAAISDAVWDEATSGHVASGSTGAAITAAGLAGDPWGTALPGAYSAGTAGYKLGNLSVTGAGATPFVYTVTQTGGAAVPDADVWATSDIAGTTVLASGRTNSSGQVTFYLDSGTTVYVWVQKTGYNFTNPDTETV